MAGVEAMPWVLALLAAVAVLAAMAAVWGRREAARLRGELDDIRRQHEEADRRLRERETELADARVRAARTGTLEEDLKERASEIAELRAANARMEAAMEAERRAHEEKVQQLTALREEIETRLKVLTGDALKESRDEFLKLAKREFENHHKAADEGLKKREEAVQGLVEPINRALKEYRENLERIEKERSQDSTRLGTLLQEMSRTHESVRAETSKLVNALRASPKTRGRWGEETLRNVMELAGMSQYVDFRLEHSVTTESGRLRPDAVIRLPGERFVVVDAKTSLSAYLDAIDSEDDDTREALLASHARQLREHMKGLASKQYWDALPVSPDFVAMFVPGDNFFAAAIERDPNLFEDAVRQRVLIVTPTTLVALAKAIAFGWRQEKVAENAHRVSELGKELYARLATMGGHVAGLGKSLESTVRHYNSFVASLETRVLPQARQFEELEVERGGRSIDEPPRVETDVREARRDRDLTFEDEAGEADGDGGTGELPPPRTAGLPGE